MSHMMHVILYEMKFYMCELGRMRWYGFNMEYEWEVVTMVDMGFECLIIVI